MEREIRYEPEHANQGGFVCYLGGEPVGVVWCYADGEELLSQLEAEIARLANTDPAPMPLTLAA